MLLQLQEQGSVWAGRGLRVAQLASGAPKRAPFGPLPDAREVEQLEAAPAAPDGLVAWPPQAWTTRGVATAAACTNPTGSLEFLRNQDVMWCSRMHRWKA